jgi:hypothetical protein
VSPNSLSYLISFGFIAFVLTGCGGDTSKPSNSSAPSPSTSAAAPASVAPVASSGQAPGFSQPLVKSTDTKASPAATVSPTSATLAGLLPGSDSDAVVRATSKGRPDPFANVVLQSSVERVPTARNAAVNQGSAPIQPIKIVKASSTRSNAGASSLDSEETDRPSTANGRVGSGLGLASAANRARKNEQPTQVAVGPKPIPNTPARGGTVSAPPVLTPVDPNRTALRDVPKPSPAAQPAFASNIQVSGVAQVNGQTQVILKLPNETFSRYISVGERVMDGKVLVKRVENPNAITPVVILEEIGIEVPRKVGDKPVVATTGAAR